MGKLPLNREYILSGGVYTFEIGHNSRLSEFDLSPAATKHSK